MTTISELRGNIEKIDAEIIEKLASRQEIVKKIGLLKNKAEKNIIDINRENQLMDFYEKLSRQYNLQPSFIQQVFKLIIMQSRKTQNLLSKESS